jgi:hypothetical protein
MIAWDIAHHQNKQKYRILAISRSTQTKVENWVDAQQPLNCL